jgi:hypothetical protein
VILGFCHDVDGMCALLVYYTALSGSYVPTFRNNLSVPSSRVKKSKQKKKKKKVGPRGCLKCQYRTTTQCCIIFQKSADLKGCACL